MPILGFAGSDGKIYCVSDSKPSFVGRGLVSEHQILRKMHRKVSNYHVYVVKSQVCVYLRERVVVPVGVGRTFWTS